LSSWLCVRCQFYQGASDEVGPEEDHEAEEDVVDLVLGVEELLGDVVVVLAVLEPVEEGVGLNEDDGDFDHEALPDVRVPQGVEVVVDVLVLLPLQFQFRVCQD
jgi:hypothetical protein